MYAIAVVCGVGSPVGFYIGRIYRFGALARAIISESEEGIYIAHAHATSSNILQLATNLLQPA